MKSPSKHISSLKVAENIYTVICSGGSDMYESDLFRLQVTGLNQTELNQKRNLLVLIIESLGESSSSSEPKCSDTVIRNLSASTSQLCLSLC